MNRQTRSWRRAAAVMLFVILLAGAAATLAEDLTWNDILLRYPGKEVQILDASLNNTYWRSWQDAQEELSEQGMTMDIFTAGGNYLPIGPAPVRIATGQFGCFYHSYYPDGARLFLIVNKGDVTGSGRLDITQLVRMAEALTNRRALTGVYELAGDISGNGEVDILDLAYLGSWLRDSMADPEGTRAAAGRIFPGLDI